mmetsp:Transcript_6688/g.12246  ORF Transcript_6688/g.12246 Transcript_6688/m.12246 type:complete len:130 (+) Transcript_6688:72-461(+)
MHSRWGHSNGQWSITRCKQMTGLDVFAQSSDSHRHITAMAQLHQHDNNDMNSLPRAYATLCFYGQGVKNQQLRSMEIRNRLQVQCHVNVLQTYLEKNDPKMITQSCKDDAISAFPTKQGNVEPFPQQDI